MSEPRSDINQLLMQVKYNILMTTRLLDWDSNEHIANCSFQME